MKKVIGQKQVAGRRRRRNKAAIVMVVLLMMLLASNWMPWTPPVCADGPSVQELAVARNLYRVSGDNGWAHEYIQNWPEYAAYIRCEAGAPWE